SAALRAAEGTRGSHFARTGPPTPSSSPVGDTTDPMHTSSGRLSEADGDRGAGQRRSSVAKSARTTDARGKASGARGAAEDAERSASDARGGTGRRRRGGRAEAQSTAGGEERRVTVTNAGKVFWPDEGYTKADLI